MFLSHSRAGAIFSLAAVAAFSAVSASAAAQPPTSPAALPPASPALPAPSPSPSSSPGLHEIGRVVTSDRRSEPLASVTKPTFVVDRATMDAYGLTTVGSALQDVPGVLISSYGAFGAQANYGIRGTTSGQTLILRDGIPISTGSNGVIDLGTISTAGLDRIEVVESGSSTLYGTNAAGGVINLIDSLRPEPYARISDGTYGDRDLDVSAGAGTFTVSFERHIATNVYDYPAFDFAGAPEPAGTRTNDYAEQSVLRLGFLQSLGNGVTARITAGTDGVDIGVPGDIAFGITPDARQGAARNDVQLELSRSAGAGAFSLAIAGSTQRLSYEDPGPQLGGEDDTYDGRVQTSLRYAAAGSRTDFVSGIDLQRESAALSFGGPYASPAFGAAESQAAAYAQLGYSPLGGTRLTAGVRAERDAPGGGVIAPSLGLATQFGPLKLTGNLGESFRVPTLIDLYYPGDSNPLLVPERLANYDVTLAAPNAGDGVSFGIFGRNGANLIALNPVSYVPYNVSRASLTGLQLLGTTRPFDHLRFTGSVTDLYRALDTVTGARLPSTPPIVATVGLERAFDGGPLAFGLRARIVGSTPTDGPQPNPYDAYTDADAYVRYRVANNVILSVRAVNVGDERYEPIYGYPAPGRTIFLELATR
jgi:vitamin B12 transporter